MNPFDPGYYDETELAEFGFRSIGRNVRVSKNNTIIGLEHISIGSNVRIDGNSNILASEHGIVIGSHTHVGAMCHISGKHGIKIGDGVAISQGSRLYTASDNYRDGTGLCGPTWPDHMTGPHLETGPICIGDWVVIGSGAIILPGVSLGTGCSVGGLSLVKRSAEPWSMLAGVPAKKIGDRKPLVLTDEIEQALRSA